MTNDFWTDEEVAQCNHAFRGEGGMWSAMTRAVELVAARGGTMDPVTLEQNLSGLECGTTTIAMVRQHISAQGARIAALEQHVSDLERSLENARKERDEQPPRADLLTVTDSGKVVAMTGHIDHYPCSDTCTHDGAATPGHPERVKALSEEVNDLGRRPENDADTFRTIENGVEGAVFTRSQTERYAEKKAEAMRAACWEAVQPLLERCGIDDGSLMWKDFKDAIEGATP